jgi:major intracellular serine protease
MDLKEIKVKLLPFSVVDIQEVADETPYGIKIIEAPAFWEQNEKGESVVVAVLDTGIDKNHPDLKDRIIAGKNFTSEGTKDDFSDKNGHGTHVAGTIAASQNKTGVVGVAPLVKLLIIKVLEGDGSGTYEGIIQGINYAVSWKGPNNEKVRVINMSLGGSVDVPELHNAIKNAVNNDIAVVVASGNEGDSDESTHEHAFPGLYNEVIEVAASDENNKLAPFSNNNKEVDAIAPGVNVLSTYTGSKYAKLSGTSMATPHVAGALALLIGKGEKHFKRTLTESEVYALLIKNTVPLGYNASSEGHGLVRLDYMNKLRRIIDYIEINF